MDFLGLDSIRKIEFYWAADHIYTFPASMRKKLRAHV